MRRKKGGKRSSKSYLFVLILALAMAGLTLWSVSLTGLGIFDGLLRVADGPSIYGLSGSVSTTGVANLSVLVGNSTDLSTNLSGFHTLSFFEGTELLFNFTHNFTNSPVDLANITIDRGANTIRVNLSDSLLIGETKTLAIRDNDTKTLCVKDQPIASITEVTGDCTGGNETEFTRAQCMSSTSLNNVTCSFANGQFIVSNLTHSGIVAQSGALGFGFDNYTFNVTRDFNVVSLLVHNLLENGTNLTANMTYQSESFPGNIVGAGTIEQILFLNGSEYFNLSFGATLADINSPNVTVNITLYNTTIVANETVVDAVIDEAQVTLLLPELSSYSFYLNTSGLDVVISDQLNTTAICGDSTKSFMIINNGSEPIGDLTTTVSGDFDVILKPSLDRSILRAGKNVTIIVQAEVNSSTSTGSVEVNVTGAGLSEIVSVNFTQPGGGWAAYPTQNDRYLIASESSFICINRPTYDVQLDFGDSYDAAQVTEAQYVGTFDDRCQSYQVHDTFFSVNGNNFLNILDDVPLGTVVSDVNTSFVTQSNTLTVSSGDYQGGGHFCANGHNTLRVKLANYSSSYCPLCDSSISTETDFSDGEDNDCDGQTDCFDLDSCGAPACAGLNDDICPTPEIGSCNDGVDNDGNGLVDCQDIGACCGASVCSSATACRLYVGNSFVDSCRTITQPGRYTLSQDITTAGDCGGAGCPDASPTNSEQCIHIRSDDVILDCDGHTITYDADGTATGLEAGVLIGYDGGSLFGNDNVVVQNCNIVDGTADAIGVGINGGFGSDNLTIRNNSITGSGADVRGIQTQGQYDKIYNNNITLTYTTGSSNGRMLLASGPDVAIYNNRLEQLGTPCVSTCFAALYANDFRHQVYNNFINYTTSSGMRLQFQGSRVWNNTLIGAGGNGIMVYAPNTTVENNTIAVETTDSDARAIRIQSFTSGDKDDIIIERNNITINTTSDTKAIAAIDTGSQLGFSDNSISHNIIVINGNGSEAAGIYITNKATEANPSVFTNNTIRVTGGTDTAAIWFSNTDGNESAPFNISSNDIEVNATGVGYGILFDGSRVVGIYDNTFQVGNGSGIYLFNGSIGTARGNTVNATSGIGIGATSFTTATLESNTVNFAQRGIDLNSTNGITIGVNTISAAATEVSITDSNTVTFSDEMFSDYQIINSGITFEDTGVSEVEFSALTVNGTSLTSDVSVDGMYVFVNGSNTGFNRSADLRFYGLSFVNPEAFVDENVNGTFVECDESKCAGETYANGTFEYNVTGFSNLTVQDTGYIVNATLIGNTNNRFVRPNELFVVESQVGCAGVSPCDGIRATLDPIITDEGPGYPWDTDYVVMANEDDGGPTGGVMIYNGSGITIGGSPISHSVRDVDITTQGDVILAGGGGNVHFYNATAGTYTELLDDGDEFYDIQSIAIREDGNLYVMDNSFGTTVLSLLNLTSLSVSTLVTDGDFDHEARAIDIDENGDVVIAGETSGGDAWIGLYDVGLDSYSHLNESAASNGFTGVKVDRDGNYVAGGGDENLYKIDASTGDVTVISTDLSNMWGVSIDSNGDYIVSDLGVEMMEGESLGVAGDGPGEGLYRIDKDTGDATSLDEDGPDGIGLLDGPYGIEVILFEGDIGGGSTPASILSTFTVPATVGVGSTTQCGAVVNETMSSVQFNITYPDMTNVLLNGTNTSNNWTSSTFTANIGGEYTCTIIANKQAGGIDTTNFTFFAGDPGVIPMGAGVPFYTTSQNPVFPGNLSCLASLNPGETCNQTWVVNATGEAGSTWEFFVIYNGSTLVTQTMNVTISDTSLLIYDDTDVEGGSLTRVPNQTVFFFANYTDLNTSGPVVGNCTFELSPYINLTNMTFNSSGNNLYIANGTIPTNGTFSYDVDCENTLDYANLSASDTVIISAQSTSSEPIPEFSDIALLLVLGLVLGGFIKMRRRQ